MEIKKSHRLIADFLDKSISKPFSPVYPVLEKKIFSLGETCSKILYSHPKLGIYEIDDSIHSSNKSNEFFPCSAKSTLSFLKFVTEILDIFKLFFIHLKSSSYLLALTINNISEISSSCIPRS